MNPKDYKAMAEIINKQVIFAKGLLTGKEKEDVILLLTAIAYKQADYFEKEEKKEMLGNIRTSDKKALLKYYNKYKQFNREQFLKDCGVKV